MSSSALRVLCVLGVLLLAGGIGIALCFPYPVAPFGQVLIIPGGVTFGFTLTELMRRGRS